MLTLLDFPLSGRENTLQEPACHHSGTQTDITGNTITALPVTLSINTLEKMEKRHFSHTPRFNQGSVHTTTLWELIWLVYKALGISLGL